MPDSKSLDYKQQAFSSTTFIFSLAPEVNLLLVWFLDFNLHRKCNMSDEYIMERYGLKMWFRNVRYPSRTRRLWYHIHVLFIAVARVCRKMLSSTGIRKSRITPKTGNS